jgi:hypothetical protein
VSIERLEARLMLSSDAFEYEVFDLPHQFVDHDIVSRELIHLDTSVSSSAVNTWSAALNDNAPPELAGGNGVIQYPGKRTTIPVLSSAVHVTDVDSANFADGNLVISIDNGSKSDFLALPKKTGSNGIQISRTSISFNGALIGSYRGGRHGQPLVITFNSDFATAASVEALLRNVTYRSASKSTPGNDREIGVVLSDGDGGTSNTLTQILSEKTSPHNSPPILSASETHAIYAEDSSPLALLDASANVTDTDSADFSGGRLTVTIQDGASDDDRLEIVNQGTRSGQIGHIGSILTYGGVVIGTASGGQGSAALVIDLDASATSASIAALLRSITFHTVGDNPLTTPRTFGFLLTDGDGGTSNTLLETIEVVAVNDSPLLSEISEQSTTRGVAITIPLTVSDADSEVVISATSSNDLVTAVIDGTVLTLIPDPAFVGTVKIDVSVSDGGAAPVSVEFEAAVRGSTVRLVNGVIVVEGTSASDDISIIGNAIADSLDVYDGRELLGTYSLGDVDRLFIQAYRGDNIVDLTALHFPIDAWIYGGNGQDRLYGGPGNDLIMGLAGADYIFGGEGDDILYGGEGQDLVEDDGTPVALNRDVIVDGPAQAHDDLLTGAAYANVIGGDGRNQVSVGTGWQRIEITSSEVSIVASVQDADENLEALSYDRRVYFDLLHAYRDPFGYIWHPGPGADERGDSLQITGLAIVAAALQMQNEDVQSLLSTIGTQPFVSEQGDARMIRHPLEMQSFESNGVVIRQHIPVTKDGMVGVIPALYYAYASPGMSDDTKALAKQVMGTYIDYFIAHSWQTLYPVPDGFSDNTSVGPESYILGPNDRYALQNTASLMGFDTAGWDVWGQWYDSVREAVDDAIVPVADQVAHWVGGQLDLFLQQFGSHAEYSFPVIPGVEWTEVRSVLDLALSAPDRANIVELFEGEFSRFIQEGLLQVFPGHVGADQVFKIEDQLGRFVDRVIDILPGWVGADRWKPALTNALGEALPWLTGDIIGQVLAFVLSHQMAKGDPITGSVKPDLVHLSFWPTLIQLKTQPEMVDLLGWSVNDLYGYISTDNEFHTELPAEQGYFGLEDVSKMDMGLYGWLSGDNNKTKWYLYEFQNDRRFDNVRYMWKVKHSEVLADILAGDQAGRRDAGFNKLDYLLLKGLQEGGRPEAASSVVRDWASHWGEVLSDIRAEVIAGLKHSWEVLKSEIGQFARKLVEEFGVTLPELARALWGNVTSDMGVLAEALYSVIADTQEVVEALWTVPGATISQVVRGVYDGITQNLGAIGTAIYDGIAHDLTSIAEALWDLPSSTATQIAEALWDIPSSTIPQVVRALYDGVTQNLSTIAVAIYDGVTHSLTSIADALWDLPSSTAAQIADALWDIPSSTIPQVVRALYDGVTQNLSTIAVAIYDGVTHSLTSIADALWDLPSSTAAQIADALWDIPSSTLSQVVRALYDGVTQNLSTIAVAIYDGVTHSLTSIADALWDLPSSTAAQIADALWDIPSSTIPQIARSLYDGVTHNLSTIARALYDGVTHTLSSIAGAIWNMGIGGVTKGQIANALLAITTSYHSIALALGAGIGGYLWEVADALTDIGANFTDAAAALWHTDIDNVFGGFDVYDLASALRDAGAGCDQVLSALRSALDYSYASALQIVNSIF